MIEYKVRSISVPLPKINETVKVSSVLEDHINHFAQKGWKLISVVNADEWCQSYTTIWSVEDVNQD